MVGFGPIGSAPIGALPEDLHFMPTAVILQQAIIVPGDKTSAGVLIQTVTNTWMQIVRLLKSDPNILFQMGPWKFEEFIAGYYERAGFDEVTLTPRSGDFGRDVIAVKKGAGCVRFIASAKLYQPGHLVTANDVRALMGVLLSDQNATKGIVTTSSDFAPKIAEDPFIVPHMPYRLELVNGNELIKRLTDLTKKK